MLTHRRNNSNLSDFALLFAEGENNEHYGDHVWTLETELPEVDDAVVAFAADFYQVDLDEAEDLVKPQDIVDTAGAWDDREFCYHCWEKFGVAGYRTPDGAVVLDQLEVKMSYHHDA